MMYDKVPGYEKGDWRNYARHTDTEIAGFFGDFRWLSNFGNGIVVYDGLTYSNSECAYQASKVIEDLRPCFVKMTAYQSKNAWKELPDEAILPNWDDRKYGVMYDVLKDKFTRNIGLRQQLLDTGDKHLEETNAWNDQFWGVDIRNGGSNNLGKILMELRKLISNNEL